MGRANSQNTTGKRVGTHPDVWKRERPTRRQRPPPTLPNDDDVVHGILFAIVVIVFVIYPLGQWALGT